MCVCILIDRASTLPSNIRGCQSGTWSTGQQTEKHLRNIYKTSNESNDTRLLPVVGNPFKYHVVALYCIYNLGNVYYYYHV